MLKKSYIFIVIICLITCLMSRAGFSPGTALAQELPGDILKRCIDEVIVILNQPVDEKDVNSNHRSQLLFDKAGEVFDFASLSMGALGTNWRRFSLIQRAEFIDLFSHVVADSYLSRMEGQNFKDVTIVYNEAKMLSPTSSGVKRADIPTIVTHNGVKTSVVYRMLEQKNTWKVYDVIIEGVSMVSNYREQYKARFMDTPEAMITELREKVKK